MKTPGDDFDVRTSSVDEPFDIHDDVQFASMAEGTPDELRQATEWAVSRRRLLGIGRDGRSTRQIAVGVAAIAATGGAVLANVANVETGGELSDMHELIVEGMVGEGELYGDIVSTLKLVNGEEPSLEDDAALLDGDLRALARSIIAKPDGQHDPLAAFKATIEALAAKQQGKGGDIKAYNPVHLFVAAGMFAKIPSADRINDGWGAAYEIINTVARCLSDMPSIIWRAWQIEQDMNGLSAQSLSLRARVLAAQTGVDLDKIRIRSGQTKGGGSPDEQQLTLDQIVLILADPLQRAADQLASYVPLREAEASNRTKVNS